MFKSKSILFGKVIIFLLLSVPFFFASQLDKTTLVSDVVVTTTDVFEPVAVDETTTQDVEIDPLHLTFVVDTSDVSYDAIKKGGVINKIKNTLLDYTDQGHTAGLLALRHDSTSKIAYEDVSTNSDLWKVFSTFSINARQVYEGNPKHLLADLTYTEMLKTGINTIKNSAGNSGKRILIFISSNRDDKEAPTNSAKQEIIQLLEEHDIELYFIGLNSTVPGYRLTESRARLYTNKENIYTGVYASNITSVFDEIIERESFGALTEIGVETPEVIEISPSNSQRAVSGATIKLYTVGAASFELIHKDKKDNYIDPVKIAEGNTSGFITEISFENSNIHLSRTETLELRITSADASANVFYSYTFSECDKYAPNIITSYVNPYKYWSDRLGFPVRTVLICIGVVLAAVYIVVIVIRIIKRIVCGNALKEETAKTRRGRRASRRGKSEQTSDSTRAIRVRDNANKEISFYTIPDVRSMEIGDSGEISLKDLIGGENDTSVCNVNGELFVACANEEYKPLGTTTYTITDGNRDAIATIRGVNDTM